MSGEKMSDRISIVRWRDPKTEPPEGDPRYVLTTSSGHTDGKARFHVVTSLEVYKFPESFDQWADLPAPSDLAVNDLASLVRWAGIGIGAMGDESEDCWRAVAARDRLRALIPNAETHDGS